MCEKHEKRETRLTEPSFAQLATQTLFGADRPLTLTEIKARVEMVRPVRTGDPLATIRGAVTIHPLIVSLGGRPARYTWWPRHLADNSFRLPLAAADLAAGALTMERDVWLVLWPDFFAGSSRTPGAMTLELTDGPTLQTGVEHLVEGQGVWGLAANPTLADWYRRQGATPADDLVLRVLDVEARRYAMTLVRRAERDEPAIAARNQALAEIAEGVLRATRPDLPDFYLLPRLIARGAYRHPLPPDPWDSVLRADLRFVVSKDSISLAEKLVDRLERAAVVWPDPLAAPRPGGAPRRARSDQERQAWGAYLFDRGMDHLWGGWPLRAEAYCRQALRLDPGHADAWVHLGNLRFAEGRVSEALRMYERGQAAAEVRTIGDPERYPAPFWLDLDSRPYMRALHGRGLCLWRLGRVEEARQVFARMLKLNPDDNQGARFLLHDLKAGLSWEESAKRIECL